MFREKALVKLKSPEQLDEALKIINRKNRLVLSAVCLLATFGLIWGIWGYIPETGRGQGILIKLNSVVPVQVQGTGQILQWFVKAGDVVNKGDVLGILGQPTIEQSLEQSIDRFAEVKEKNQNIDTLRKEYSSLERDLIRKKRAILSSRIEYLEGYIEKNRSISESLRKKNEELLERELKNLETARQDTIGLVERYKERLKSYESLWKERLIPEASLQDNRQYYEDAKMKVNDIDLKIQEIALKKAQMKEDNLKMEDLLASMENDLTSLKLQMQELNNREAEIDKSDSEIKFQQKTEQDTIMRNIEKSEKQLKVNREIRSKFSGRILELTRSEGQIVNEGYQVALIERLDTPSELYGLAYFKAKEGKQLYRGKQLHVSPSVVSRKQYGSILGIVESISDYLVTEESAINYVGNSSVAQGLIAGDYRMEVIIKMVKNEKNPSGYEWTSGRGPDVHITAGTLADIWVTLEQRAPVSYILPKIKQWTGI